MVPWCWRLWVLTPATCPPTVVVQLRGTKGTFLNSIPQSCFNQSLVQARSIGNLLGKSFGNCLKCRNSMKLACRNSMVMNVYPDSVRQASSISVHCRLKFPGSTKLSWSDFLAVSNPPQRLVSAFATNPPLHIDTRFRSVLEISE